MLVVLVLASGAAWESRALTVLDREPGLVVLRRCVDVPDLLAAASAGQAEAAVVAIEAPGLDAIAVDRLRGFQVRVVAVVPPGPSEAPGLQAARIGVTTTVRDDDLDALPEALRVQEGPPTDTTSPDTAPGQIGDGDPARPDPQGSPSGRVLVVWGPAGAPGRTTVAIAVAAELAARGRRTTLVDADPYAGTVAQQLGVLDEVSGLLAAARLAGTPGLEQRFASVQRAVGPGLTVVTGLPRADRWVEVRAGVVDHLLDLAVGQGDAVVDTGFSLESDPVADLGRPSRNHLTLAAAERADELLVVGAADPVGLARLARGLVEVRELDVDAPVRVVVNRMRPSLGWSEPEIVGMVEGFGPVAGVHFLPDDRAALDRAVSTGRTLRELGDSAVARSVAALVDAIGPSATGGRRRVRSRLGRSSSAGAVSGSRRGLRRRRAGTAHRR